VLGERDGTGLNCWYCSVKLTRLTATLDHVTPRVNGGSDDNENLVLACRVCNEKKSDMELEAYRALLQLDLPKGERVIFHGEQIRMRRKIDAIFYELDIRGFS
jgi:5-methylcytosine-specific restriction endonuclease McrA